MTAGLIVREARGCHTYEFPRLDQTGMQGPPLGGLLLFWAIGLQKVDDSPPACRHWARRVHCAYSCAAETLVVRFPKSRAVRGPGANPAGSLIVFGAPPRFGYALAAWFSPRFVACFLILGLPPSGGSLPWLQPHTDEYSVSPRAAMLG